MVSTAQATYIIGARTLDSKTLDSSTLESQLGHWIPRLWIPQLGYMKGLIIPPPPTLFRCLDFQVPDISGTSARGECPGLIPSGDLNTKLVWYLNDLIPID